MNYFPLGTLAKDIDENNPQKGNGFSGITLAYNVEHKQEDVETVIALVRKAGGKTKRATGSFGVDITQDFSDLDGYYWEVSWGLTNLMEMIAGKMEDK